MLARLGYSLEVLRSARFGAWSKGVAVQSSLEMALRETFRPNPLGIV